MKTSTSKRIEVLFEFLFFGIIFGIIEDIVAVRLTTNEPITLKIVGIIIIIAIPFAVLGELIADNINFVKLFRRIFKSKEK